MAEIDRYTIKELGISGLVLMEQAGRRVVEFILANYDNLEQVAVLVGTGNNGGDGFVISRLLSETGIKVKIVLVGSKEDISGDAKVNLGILENLDYQVKETTELDQIRNLQLDLEQSDLIVDALLGTGIKGQLRGLFPDLITVVNELSTPVVAVDIPSGVEADTGIIRDVAIQANQTVTFALPKLGLLLYPGTRCVGNLEVVEIGIPKQVVTKQEIKTNLITAGLVADLFPVRDDNSHKCDYGKLLIVATSKGMTGAGVLTAQASLKMGAGLVTLAVPSSLNYISEVKLTEAMTYPLADKGQGFLAKEAALEIKELSSSRDVLAIGPGLTTKGGVSKVVNEVLRNVDKTIVVDADGLNAINDLAVLKERSSPTVLTPHPGEMSRLIEKPIAEVEAKRVEIARQFAVNQQVHLVLKGARTVIANPSGEVYLNQRGNSALSTGGSGDVLTGLITSLLGQGLTAKKSAIIAVYLHGLSAELGSKEATKYSLLPSDLLEYLPQAIKTVN